MFELPMKPTAIAAAEKHSVKCGMQVFRKTLAKANWCIGTALMMCAGIVYLQSV